MSIEDNFGFPDLAPVAPAEAADSGWSHVAHHRDEELPNAIRGVIEEAPQGDGELIQELCSHLRITGLTDEETKGFALGVAAFAHAHHLRSNPHKASLIRYQY